MSDTVVPRPDYLDQAEAEKLKAEAEAARADAARHAAEARKANAEALEVEHKAAKAAIDLEREEYKRSRELAANEHHHLYHFAGGVDGTSVAKCVDQLTYWARTEKPSSMEIVFFSPGGSVFAGMALFDHILQLRDMGWHVTTMCRGYAASMGGILVQAGTVRAMGRESFLHIHEVAAMTGGKTSELEDQIKLMEKMEKRVIDIFASRSKLTPAKIRAGMKRKEWWIDSTEALKVGLVDEIR